MRNFKGRLVVASIAAAMVTIGSAQAQQVAAQDKAAMDAAGFAVSKPAVRQIELSPAQLQEAQARITAAKALLARFDADASAQNLGAEWKGDHMRALLALPSAQIKAIAADRQVTSLGTLRTAQREATAGRTNEKVLGSFAQDLVFYPITPCRNADTRLAGGKITGGTARPFNGDTPVAQGGTAGCGVVPISDAGAWALNITVINMTTQGFVAVRSVGATNISAAVNYTGPGQQVNNFIIVANNRSSGSEWEVYAATTVDVIIDLFGYFYPPEATALDCTYPQGSSSIGAGATGSASSACTTGYALTGGACYLTGTSATLNSSGSILAPPNTWYCYGVNPGGGSVTLFATAYCCRVPGH